ncbi:MAG TPA: hypothetical protein VHE60_12225 [Pyrinomonadaceae bacterium]|nr:hypothetical protein [Pyrinomonadaceae bacterium]
MKKQTNHARHHVGLILALVGLISVTTLVLSPARLASAQAVAPSWSYTGNLNISRVAHTATLLLNGKVLVVGGNSSAIHRRLHVATGIHQSVQLAQQHGLR